MTQPSISLVGNAPHERDRSASIDASESVIRINNCFGLGGVNGSRTTHLFLINCGGQMREWLDDPDFLARPAVAQAGEILLPIHPGKDDLVEPPLDDAERSAPDARNWAPEAEARLRANGRSVTRVEVDIFLRACAVIGYGRPLRDMSAPSTGLIALLWALETFDNPIDVYGFGFDGWDGHRWSRERALFETMHGEGRVRLHPLS
ncbi:hypothetical protein [Aurantimonas manganoxydans]|uniref:hypothetical protein n=1 Tax=Aurantimonas manganoxydans TaxID=651183 RepID=UPI0002ECBC90|nr:hypothetical protein [Aurantimonas manganoxydans]